MVLFVIHYKKGPLFARFQAYRSTAGKRVATDFKFNTEAAMTLPHGIIFEK
jgi:hypothetical protein